MINTTIAVPSTGKSGCVKNVSGFVGVYWQAPKGRTPRWIAQVTLANGKRKAVPGRFDSAQEASDARMAFIALHGTAAPAKPCEVAL